MVIALVAVKGVRDDSESEKSTMFRHGAECWSPLFEIRGSTGLAWDHVLTFDAFVDVNGEEDERNLEKAQSENMF